MTNSKTSYIRKHVLNYIKEHKLSDGDSIPSNRQLIKELGVSQVTVTTALKKLIEEGVLRSVRGQSLQVCSTTNGHRGTVALVVPGIMLSYFHEIIDGFEEVLRPNGYGLNIVYHRDFSNANNEKLLDELGQQNFKAIVMAVSFSQDSLERWRLKYNTPMLLLDENLDSSLHEVISDNFEGGRLVGEHLLKQNCRNIIFMGKLSSKQTSVIERYNGLCHAWEAAGCSIDNITTIDKVFNRKSSRQALADHLNNNGLDFDGIFAYMDLVAAGACEELIARKIKIPEQVKIAGFSNLSEVNDCPISITTVDQNMRELAIKAARELIASFERDTQVIFKMIRPVKLIVRNSTDGSLTQKHELFDIELKTENSFF